MSVDISIDERNAKKIAKALQDRFAELGIEVKLGQAYEAMASMAGFRNWHALKARIDGAECEVAPTLAAAPSKSGLADALWAAAFKGEEDGTVGAAEAKMLIKASQGDADAVSQLASACGHVPVVMIDVDAEIDRWHGAFASFLQASTGSEAPFNRENMTEAAKEFAVTTGYSRAALGDFFNDWLHERIGSGDAVRGRTPG